MKYILDIFANKVKFKDAVYIITIFFTALSNLYSNYSQQQRLDKALERSQERIDKLQEITNVRLDKINSNIGKLMESVSYKTETSHKISSLTEKMVNQSNILSSKLENTKEIFETKVEGVKNVLNLKTHFGAESQKALSYFDATNSFLSNNIVTILILSLAVGTVVYGYYYWYKPAVSTLGWLASFFKPFGGGGGDDPSGGSSSDNNSGVNALTTFNNITDSIASKNLKNPTNFNDFEIAAVRPVTNVLSLKNNDLNVTDNNEHNNILQNLQTLSEILQIQNIKESTSPGGTRSIILERPTGLEDIKFEEGIKYIIPKPVSLVEPSSAIHSDWSNSELINSTAFEKMDKTIEQAEAIAKAISEII